MEKLNKILRGEHQLNDVYDGNTNSVGNYLLNKVKTETTITLNKQQLIEILCSAFNLSSIDAKLTVIEIEKGDDRFGHQWKEFDGVKITTVNN